MMKHLKFLTSILLAVTVASVPSVNAADDLLTPEKLWSMARIGSVVASPDGDLVAYTQTTYDIKENKGHTAIYVKNIKDGSVRKLNSDSNASESDPAFIADGKKIAFLANRDGVNQLWVVNTDGSSKQCISDEKEDILGFLFSPDEKHVVLVHEIPTENSIAKNDDDLPKASGMLINELMYKHWDTYVKSIPHPFLAEINNGHVVNAVDMLEGQPYECPMMPFGGMEEFAWSPDSKKLAYVLRQKTGRDYAVSTDSDIFLYDLESGATLNLCKPVTRDIKQPRKIDYTRSLKDQRVYDGEDCNLGYDDNPKFSPDGKYIAWTSMKHDGYESDRTRLCVYNFASREKTYVTESFDSGVDNFQWKDNSKELFFAGVWHGRTNIYTTNLKGAVKQLTDDVCDYSIAGYCAAKGQLIVKRHSISQADEIYTVDGKNGKCVQLTEVNKATYDNTTFGKVEERWVNTVDGKKELCWVVFPPHFDASKKYPTLLFCEGGPQSPVSQFWSYRWNFQIMVANGYIIIAPNRRGLPGFGTEWLEEISGDYTGLCMQDYLAAIDDISKESYVDSERLGCVGASFGGYSVYWLAGHHEGRFKCFIAHDGIFNTQQQYVETEEMWFANWDMGTAPWVKPGGKLQNVFSDSPHLSVDKWDTPILCIHGQRDFRIEYTQAESAFNAARLRGIPAQLLLFPDENHWVLKPQNGIMWQRTFFRWLDKWLKK